MMYHSDISTKKKMYHSYTYLRNNILRAPPTDVVSLFFGDKMLLFLSPTTYLNIKRFQIFF